MLPDKLTIAYSESDNIDLGVNWILNQAKKRGEGYYLIVGNEYPKVRESIMNALFQANNRIGIFRNVPMEFDLLNGKIIQMGISSTPNFYTIRDYNAVWIDECGAANFNKEAFYNAMKKSSITQAERLVTFSSIANEWFLELYNEIL